MPARGPKPSAERLTHVVKPVLPRNICAPTQRVGAPKEPRSAQEIAAEIQQKLLERMNNDDPAKEAEYVRRREELEARRAASLREWKERWKRKHPEDA